MAPKKQVKKLKEQIKILKSQTQQQMTALITSAFAFTAALFWRDAIRDFLEQTLFIKTGQGWWPIQLLIATLVSIIAVVVIYSISRFEGKK